MAKTQVLDERPHDPPGLWRLSEWIGIALYAVIIFQYLSLWISPGPDDGEKILTLSVLFMFEFVLAHSGMFMALFPRKTALFIFIPFYSFFALAINAIIPGNAITFLYGGVVLMRMRFIFSAPLDPARGRAFSLSLLSMFLFIICMFGFSAAAGILPKLGLTEVYLEAIDFANITKSPGDFIRNPHAAMAAGTVYFTLLALTEIKINGLLRKRAPFKA